MSEDYFIRPWVNQLWPPEGDNGVTNMDVVFFSDLEDERTAPPLGKPGETWVQKGRPEVCWPQQWLPEDLGSNVRIFEIRPSYYSLSTGVLDRSGEEAALRQLDSVAEESLEELLFKISIEDEDGQGCPLVFVGHGYGGLVLKQALVKLHDQSGLCKDLQSNLCGIVFYGATNTKLTKLEDWWLEDPLLELSKRFEAALDLKKVKVCVVNKNKSFLQEIEDYSDLEHRFTDVMDNNDICTPTSKDDPSYLKHQFTDVMESDDICTPTSKDDPSYLKRQFIDVMDSNDICTPTSKDDPSYLTLLEFLQQFLPKGLHQTIDDKKGQEVQLRLSEKKDEAWGDMEIASTSTRESRDKEMDERQCVLQHVVGNVDQDHDMLIEEAYKLQMFFEMAQRHGGSTIFPNLHEHHSMFLEDTSIFTGARKKVEMDSVEFLFLDAQCMSKVVGVGLQQSLVTVTNDNDVKVEALSESAWGSFLASMFMEVQYSGGFELIGFKMPKMEEDKSKTMSLPSKDVAIQFGLGLKDFLGNYFVTMNKREQNNMFFPVIWKVAKEYKAFKHVDPPVTKRPSGVGSSTSHASGASGAPSSGSSQQGKDKGKGVQSWSLLKPITWLKWGKGDEKDDEGKPPGGDPPPDSEPSSEPEMVPCRFTVKVYPEAGCKFRDARDIPPQIKTASMKPKLTIVFSRDKTGAKFLDVTTQTQCNLGCDVDTEHYFGWFQDDIKISFQGSLPECAGAELKDFIASVQRGEEGELTKETTNITLGGSTSVANLESRGMFGQAMIAGSGMRVQGREDTTNTFGQNSSRADTEEIIGVKQIEGFNVHNHNFEENLIYKFCIPRGIRDSNNPTRFLRYSDTFTPIIVGNWEVSKENACEAANYTFKVERHLFHIEQGAVTFGRGRLQDYVLEMFINLKMTHLDGLCSDKTIEIRGRSFVGPAIQVFPVQ